MGMEVKMPANEEMIALLGQDLYDIWLKICDLIESKYDMERQWNTGGKAWVYEYKYRRGGKTLCALYAREACLGFMVILGKDERARFEAQAADYSPALRRLYDETRTYHDGKWLMLEPKDAAFYPDIERLLLIKRKPNKKQV